MAYSFPLAKLSQSLAPGKSRAIALIAGGSLSPPTYLHLRLFEQARDWIHHNKKEWQVVGGYFSPVSDAYAKKDLAPAKDRIEMCRLATDSSEWIMSDPWEALLPHYSTTIKVLRHFYAELNHHRQLKLGEVTPMLLCGTDLLDSFNTPGVWAEADMHEILSEFGVVCLERVGKETAEVIASNPILFKHRENILLVPQTIVNDISSTKIRHAIRSGHSIKYLTADSVIKYIYDRGLWG